MTYWNLFLFVILPYLCLASMLVGLVWRWRTDQFGWTSRSSGSFERTWLRISSPLFHFGILFVLAGHIIGLAIPMSWTSAVGISESMYHVVALSLGLVAAVMTIVGLVGLLVRRLVVKSVRLATSRSDIIMYIMLLIPIALGTAATVSKQLFGPHGGYDYRETISPWFRSLFYFHPDVNLMTDVPLVFKAHIVAGFLLFALWPYTRLVHAFSAPVGYVTRPYLVYRSKDTAVGEPETARGWQSGTSFEEATSTRQKSGSYHLQYRSKREK